MLIGVCDLMVQWVWMGCDGTLPHGMEAFGDMMTIKQNRLLLVQLHILEIRVLESRVFAVVSGGKSGVEEL